MLFDSSQLKRVPRTGWLLRGVGRADTESVAEHTYGMAMTALVLAQWIDEPIDVGRLLSICLLHDLAESQILDLVPSALRYLTREAKQAAEEAALTDLLRDMPCGEEWLALWREFEDGSSPEGRLARDADRIEMMVQAAAYERAGWKQLGEFWESSADYVWHYPLCEALFHHLIGRGREEQE